MDIYNFLKQETIKFSLAAIANDEILKEKLSDREDVIERLKINFKENLLIKEE